MESGEEDTGKNGAETETEIGPRTMKSPFDNKGSAVKTIRRTARYLDLRNGVRYDTEEQKRGSAIINDSVSTLDMDRSIGENIPDHKSKGSPNDYEHSSRQPGGKDQETITSRGAIAYLRLLYSNCLR